MASSAQEALRKESKTSADDCWVDDEWLKNNLNAEGKHVGYGKKNT